MHVFLDLMWFFKTRKKQYTIGILLLMSVSFIGLFPPKIIGHFVDHVQHRTLTAQFVWTSVIAIALMALAMYVLRYYWRVLLFGSAIELSTTLRLRLFQHLSNMSPSFYQKHRVGDLMAHATNDIQAVESTATDGILTLVDSISTGLLVIATMAATIDWKLTIAALLPMPIMAYTTSRYGNILHRRFETAQAAFSDLNDKVHESINGVRAIKAFGQEDNDIASFSELSQDVVQKNMAVARIDALFDPTIQVIVGASFFLAFAVGAIFVVHHQLTLGDLTSFSIYLGQLIWPMLAFGFLFNIVERGRASHDRVQAILSIAPDIVDKPHALQHIEAGNLTYEIHQFHYPDSQDAALSDIQFTLSPGQTLGVVGKTGSGKTTLLRLLLREFDVDSGDIFIGDHSMYDVTLDEVRRHIAYVPQDHFLFSASVADNIAFGRFAATREEIESVAKLASVHGDILGFPEGYDTLVGERGVTLSGGQKQRISIARALLLDTDILILDDCLSAVDARTEAAILEGIKSRGGRQTTLIATHRLSAVEHADLILVLQGGHISERGTHAELMAKRGWYATMYEHQQLEAMVEQGGAV
ncbi:ABC transporter transmembrane domain-containing protein [Alicyclobacillus fastidiosus]|uniref:ABC transporter transmembrane domain-containing protein n=1 Tax=Alicyclobacillus fastidiosus TaxID=392011 RepID=A0ABV5AIJ4_9BACL|nr:ABC transporter transmembrane domain-containing protein [Alicyclobacillus fastidiosus]WEH09220.1 ABC transporter transmembrane domain-containing protein [Alicyclobacillus fastidiosus]